MRLLLLPSDGLPVLSQLVTIKQT